MDNIAYYKFLSRLFCFFILVKLICGAKANKKIYMFDSLKRIFGFIKQNPSILYSLFLIVFLPLILWGNTVFVITSFEKNIDFITQEKALSIENILGEFISEKISDPEFLQEQVNKISKQVPEISDLQIITYQDGKFKIIASQEQEKTAKEISDPSISLAWHQEQDIAHLVGSKGERFWKTAKLLKNENKEKIALISLKLSLKNTDLWIARVAQISYIAVMLAIFLVLFLVFHHTRLFQYLKLSKELQELDKIRESFFRMAIHELQSPITNIRAYIECLKEEIGDKILAERKEDLERISISAKSLSELIYDILKVIKIEHQVLDLTPEDIFPSAIVTEIIESTKTRIEGKGIIFNCQTKKQDEKTDWVIKINANRFREILTNLIENAIKYTNKGKIEIEEWPDFFKKKYYFSIKDTGIGISGEEQQNLFEKFYRIKNKETSGIPGTGLGLWIVKNLCQKMQGSIMVESIKNIGTKFTISFPLKRN